MFISDYLPSKNQPKHCRNKFCSACTQVFLKLCRDFKELPQKEGVKEGYLS